MVGCAHNLERWVKHTPSAVSNLLDERGRLVSKLQYVAGDAFSFVCPHGCPDIVVAVKTGKRETKGG